MAKQETKTQVKDNECPKCHFEGNTSDSKKFSQEQINQFPKGYASENHPKIEFKIRHGQKLEQFVKDNETKEIIFDEIKRCPVCGHTDGDEL